MAEEDTWEPRENLENAEDLVKEFKEEYGEGIQKVEKKIYGRITEGNYPEGIEQKCYMGGIIRDLIESIGGSWKGIG